MTRSARRGSALLVALWVVVALGAVATVVVRDGRAGSALALNARAEVVARAAAESGIEVLRAAIEDTLARLPFGTERREWLNGLEDATGRGDTVVLGDGRVAWAVLDVNARLDVNAATEASLATFFGQFTSPLDARSIARAIRARVGGADAQAVTQLARPLRSVDELGDLGLVPMDVLVQAEPFLTTDGEGVINQRRAPDEVMAAATGELRDEPSRLLLVSRGWMSNHALTHEMQVVVEIQLDRLVIVRVRERVL